MKDALLREAERLFAERGYDGVSLKDLAEAAGVTPAMIHYYFKGKEGLHAAMLEDITARLLEQFVAIAGAPAEKDPLKGFMDIATQMVMAEPWAVSIVVRDVLLQPGAMRDQFVDGYATRVRDLFSGWVEEAKASGAMRAELDPAFLLLSVLGMTAFPFLARGVAEPLLGLAYDDAMRSAYVDHAARLVQEGTAPTKGSKA